MKYVAFRRAKISGIGGPVNIPCGGELTEENGTLFFRECLVCLTTSQNGHDYFARDDDGNGIERGKLTASIISRLSVRDKNYQARWDKIWNDAACQKYKREDYEDYWLWNQAFFDASIFELRRIEHLISV